MKFLMRIKIIVWIKQSVLGQIKPFLSQMKLFLARPYHTEISPGISVSCGDERERYFYTGSERTDQKCHEKSRVTDLV